MRQPLRCIDRMQLIFWILVFSVYRPVASLKSLISTPLVLMITRSSLSANSVAICSAFAEVGIRS